MQKDRASRAFSRVGVGVKYYWLSRRFEVVKFGICSEQFGSATLVFVDGHLRLRAPYPVRSAKLSSLKLG